MKVQRFLGIRVAVHVPSIGVILVRQYRHPPGRALLEIPAGSFDPGEEAEEIGYQADDIIALGGFYLAPGWSTEYMHIFLARHLHPAEAAADEDEEIHLERVPMAELGRRAADGEIRDAKTLAALYLARAYLQA
jgi:8-oxo-dGTP pyrophosphatase MutT (NUDIX family)